MRNQSYYRDMDNPGCNIHHDGDPLVVNCSGYVCMDMPFITRHEYGRVDYYLQIMDTGHLLAYPDKEAEEFLPGMFIIHKPTTRYHYELLPGNNVGYFWVHYSGFHAGRLLHNLGIETNRIYNTDGSVKRRQRIAQSFECIFAEFINRRPGMDEACGALLTDIMVDLARGVDKLKMGEKRKLSSLSYLHQHFQENIRVKALADMEHLSESRYREVFRQHTGFSPTDYRTALRIQYACDQLAKTDSSITKIAADCGYDDVLYFLRIFKQKKGITPGSYRNQHRYEPV